MPWTSWSPAFATKADGTPLVQARYQERDPEDDAPRQRVEAKCLECGAELRVTCDSGQPRRHVQVFAKTHVQEHFPRYKVRP
jgi:hypothetical protein